MTARPTVLFICEHGSAKSLLAKTLFERHARDAGLDVAAESRGTDADAEVPPWMRARLAEARIEVGGFTPRSLRREDVAGAALVVTFDIADAALVGATPGTPRERWDAMPPASGDFAASREAIEARVRALVDSLVDGRATSAVTPSPLPPR